MSAEYTLELPLRPRERSNPLASTADAIRRHPLSAFFAFAYALSWWPSVLYLLTGWGSPILGCGPFLAAIVVLSLTSGKPGLKQLFHSMLKWRVAPRWWAVAILLPIAVTLAAAGMNIALRADPQRCRPRPLDVRPADGARDLADPPLRRSLGGAGLARIRSPSSPCSTLCAGGESRPGNALGSLARAPLPHGQATLVRSAARRHRLCRPDLALPKRARERARDDGLPRDQQRLLGRVRLSDVHRQGLGPTELDARDRLGDHCRPRRLLRAHVQTATVIARWKHRSQQWENPAFAGFSCSGL